LRCWLRGYAIEAKYSRFQWVCQGTARLFELFPRMRLVFADGAQLNIRRITNWKQFVDEVSEKLEID
jgi:hypothetical protein